MNREENKMPIDDALEELKTVGNKPENNPEKMKIVYKPITDSVLYPVFEDFLENYMSYNSKHFTPYIRFSDQLLFEIASIPKNEFLEIIEKKDEDMHYLLTNTDLGDKLPEHIDLDPRKDRFYWKHLNFLDFFDILGLESLYNLLLKDEIRIYHIKTISLFLEQGELFSKYVDNVRDEKKSWQAVVFHTYHEKKLFGYRLKSHCNPCSMFHKHYIHKFTSETGEKNIAELIKEVDLFFKELKSLKKPHKQLQYLYNQVKTYHPEFTYEETEHANR